MKARTLGVLAGLAFLAVSAFAVDKKDYYERPATLAVGITGGDTVTAYSVTCSSSASTALRPAVTDRSRRQICIQNQGASKVLLGTSSVVAESKFYLGESTNSALSPLYCSKSSGAFYCSAVAGSTSQTVVVLEETQSIP